MMMRSSAPAQLIVVCALLLATASAAAQEPDLIVTGARVWTGDADRPWAEAVSIGGDRIIAVGDSSAILGSAGPGTRVIRVADGFVAPGFIDNHTHFGSAGALLLGVNLLDVADEAGLVERVRQARDRLPRGAWILGGDWGAYEDWAMGATGAEERRPPVAERFRPLREMIDSITPANPVLLSRWDRSEYLANDHALELAGIGCDMEGVDCRAGQPTGLLSAGAAATVRQTVPPKSMEQRLAESRLALAQLRELGVTTIHDNTAPDQLRVYQELRRRGELTVRVYARPTLDRWEQLAALGIEHGFGDKWIRIGGLKGFVDGIMGNSTARFHEPYVHTGERGLWREMMRPAGNMERLLVEADAAGHWPQVHAIGDEAIDTLITMFEHLTREQEPRERRLRIIHTQVIRGPEVAQRMARLNLIAEVQPYHAIDDMRWMEERIGERSRWAYAFRTLDEAGVLLSFGSDWPGTNASWYPADPLLGIHAAVTRQTLDGEPAGGWFPEERIDVETALRAYTVNNAFAAGEEDSKGALSPGLLADLVVLDGDPFRVGPEAIKDSRVLLTVVGGRVVYHRGRSPGAEVSRDAVPR